MPIQLATDILRRLQDTIYTRDSNTHNHTTTTSTASAPMTHNDHIVRDSDDHSIDMTTSDSASSTTTSTSTEDYSPPMLSPHFSQFTPRVESTTTSATSIRRQSSIVTPSTPDVNAQSILRKRILDIQLLDLDEREKASRVQVGYPLYSG